jgi:hypothetical protein
VTVTGFKKLVRQGLNLEVRQTVRIDAKIEVGAASEVRRARAGSASQIVRPSLEASGGIRLNFAL